MACHIPQQGIHSESNPCPRFFRFCYENFSPNAHLAKHEDYPPNDQPPRQVIKTTTLPNGIQVEEEVEMISDFSWRNFFTVINLTKIMQKLTKARPHRIMLLVHHKSTVSHFCNEVFVSEWSSLYNVFV